MLSRYFKLGSVNYKQNSTLEKREISWRKEDELSFERERFGK